MSNIKDAASRGHEGQEYRQHGRIQKHAIVVKRPTRYTRTCFKSILPTVQFNEKRWKASDESACYKQNKLQVTKEYNKRK